MRTNMHSRAFRTMLAAWLLAATAGVQAFPTARADTQVSEPSATRVAARSSAGKPPPPRVVARLEARGAQPVVRLHRVGREQRRLPVAVRGLGEPATLEE